MTTPKQNPSPHDPVSDPILTPVPAPVPQGDVVPGEPAVPITVWYLPRTAGDPPVPAALSRRLVANYVRPGRGTVDLTSTAAAPRAKRRSTELVITQWPPLPGSGSTGSPMAAGPDAATHLASCAQHLAPGGCLAVVVQEPQSHDMLGVLVGTAHAVGLAYLQHIVVVHHLRSPDADSHADAAPASPWPPPSGQVHLRVHTDLLIFRTPGTPSRGSRSRRRA